MQGKAHTPDPSTDAAQAAAQLAANIAGRRQVEAFVLAFDSNLAPIVGQQVTLGPKSGDDLRARIGLLEARAAASECDLVVKGSVGGFLYVPASNAFAPDKARGALLSDRALSALAAPSELTFTAVPPGSGRRIGIDRDADGVLDGDEAGRSDAEEY